MELGVFEGFAHGLAQYIDTVFRSTRRQEKESTHQSENPEPSDHSRLTTDYAKMASSGT